MSFTDQKRRIADEKTCRAMWGGGKDGASFRCGLCGHRFVPGDGWRWVYAGGAGLPNFEVCDECDDEDTEKLFGRMREIRDEFRSDKFWWWRRQIGEAR